MNVIGDRADRVLTVLGVLVAGVTPVYLAWHLWRYLTAGT